VIWLNLGKCDGCDTDTISENCQIGLCFGPNRGRHDLLTLWPIYLSSLFDLTI